MDHPTLASNPRRPAPARSPLTRLRVTNRPPVPPPEAPADALLPDRQRWSTLLGGAELSHGEAAALNGVVRVRQVGAGGLVFQRGDPAGGMVALGEGDVALGERGESSGFRTERHVHGPAWLDCSTGWVGEAHAQDARAMTVCTVLDLPRDPLQHMLDRQPGLARRLIVTLAHEVRAQAVSTRDLMHKDAPARLAAWLMARCQVDPMRPDHGVVQLPMRKRDIASQLAITPETLSRLMRHFSSQGVLQVTGYTVDVVDLPALRQLAGP